MSADEPRAGLPAAARFAVVGVVNTAIDLVLFVVLSAAGSPLLVANFVSTSAGMVFSFSVNRRWSFGSTRSVRRSLVPFLTVTATGLWVLQPLVIASVLPLLGSAGDAPDRDLFVAKALAIVVGLVWNYSWYRRVVFAPSVADVAAEEALVSPDRNGSRALDVGSLLVAALFVWVTANVVLAPKFSAVRWSQAWTAVAALVALALLVGAVIATRSLVERLESRRWARRAIVSAFFVLLFAVQVRVGYAIRFDPGWDAGAMEFFTKGVVDGSLTVRSVSDAYSQYPNNVFLASLMIWLWRAWFGAGFADTDLALMLVNATVLTTAVLFTYLSARRVGRPAVAYVMLALAVVLVGFSPWLGVVYSDTVGMLPIAVLAYLACLLATTANPAARAATWAGIGVVGAIGYQIKPTVVFAVIAAVLVGLLTTRWRLWTRGTTAARVAAVVALGVGGLVGTQACSLLVEETDMTTAPERRVLALPLAHFMMMGAAEKPGLYNNFYGAYRDEDYAATSSLPPGPERAEFAFDEYKRRVAAMGPVDYARFLNNKATWTLGDGTFFVYGEGGMSPDPMPFANTSETDRLIQSFMNLRGEHFVLTANVWQATWLLVLLLMGAPLLLRRDHDLMSPPAATMRAAVLGLTVFILLFEGRSRYVYLYVPFFILLASLGVAALAERFRPTAVGESERPDEIEGTRTSYVPGAIL